MPSSVARLSALQLAQLGMRRTTAYHRLTKILLFSFVQKCGQDVCFRCGERIKTVAELTIEHKEDWLGHSNPADIYFDVANIAFSHLRCNSRAGRKRKLALSPAERVARRREANKLSQRRSYTPEKRRAKYLKYGC